MDAPYLARHFRLPDARFARIQPLPPDKVGDVPRVDDQRTASGIVQAICNRVRRRDAPAGSGPCKTLHSHFAHWSKVGTKVVRPSDSAIEAPRGLDRQADNPWRIAGRKPGSHLTGP